MIYLPGAVVSGLDDDPLEQDGEVVEHCDDNENDDEAANLPEGAYLRVERSTDGDVAVHGH